MTRRALLAATALAAALGTAAPAAAQESGTFVLIQNGTEIARESFTRSDGTLATQLEIPDQGVVDTEAVIGAEATVDRMEIRALPAGDPDAEPLQSTAAEFRGDSIFVEQPIGTDVAATAAPSGTIPYLNPSPSYMEQILRRARAVGGSEVTVQIWVPGQGAGQTVPAQVAFSGDGSATLTLGTAAIQLQTDETGRVLAGEVPAQGLVIERR